MRCISHRDTECTERMYDEKMQSERQFVTMLCVRCASVAMDSGSRVDAR